MATAKAKLIEKARQFAALPWRDAGHGIEVLLISSRGTGRWVIPKGWPIKGLGLPCLNANRDKCENARNSCQKIFKNTHLIPLFC